MDDFVVNVRQIVQYPRKSAPTKTDLVLLQESDAQGIAAGAYKSAFVSDLVKNALTAGGFIQFPSDGTGGIKFNGAELTYSAGMFQFTTSPVNMLRLNTVTAFVNGQAVATQQYVNEVVAGLGDAINSVVHSFNGRHGDVILEDVDILRAGGVLQNNAHFFGNVTAPTFWDPKDNTDRIATTAFVQQAICFWLMHSPLVQTFNGRSGAVVLTDDDITAAATAPGATPRSSNPPFGDASNRIATTLFVDESIADLRDWVIDHIAQGIDLSGYALLDSPQFVGIPTAPTANPGTTTGQLATTAFVMNAVAASTAGVASFNTRTGAVTLITADVTAAGGAPISSPTFTGTPAGPTAAPGTSTTQLATTAFVAAALTNATGNIVSSFNTRTGAVTLTTADITGAGGAPVASPALTGTPTAPTATAGTNTTQVATTAFVQAAVATASGGVSSWNGRTGAVTLQASDVSAVGGALILSPTFTGIPKAPTAAPGTNTTQLATTEFVMAALGGGTSIVSSFNGRTGAVSLTTADITGAGGAPISSPAFTGTPTAPTVAQTVNDGTLATTAYVRAAIAAATGVASFNGRTGVVTLTAADVTGVGGALLASPTFTGTPAAPTAAPMTNTTQIATTAFVQNAVAASVVSFNGRTGAITFIGSDITGAGGALIASPAFTGTPTAPTPTTGTNNTQLATTAFVNAAITAAGGVTFTQGDAAPAFTSTFWFDSARGQLYVRYTDPSTSAQNWVVANTTPPAVPNPGTPVLIMSQTVSVAVAAVDFTSGIDSTYDEYELVFFGIKVSADANLGLRVSTDGGATFKNGVSDYYYGYAYINITQSNSVFASSGGAGAAYITITGSIANATGSPNNVTQGRIRFYSPSSTSARKPFQYEAWYPHVTLSFSENRGHGTYSIDNLAINALRLLVTSGNFTAGVFKLYGIKK